MPSFRGGGGEGERLLSPLCVSLSLPLSLSLSLFLSFSLSFSRGFSLSLSLHLSLSFSFSLSLSLCLCLSLLSLLSLSVSLARPAPAHSPPVHTAYRPVDGKRSAPEGGKSRQFCSTSGEEMLRKSRALRNAGLRRRAPAHLAVPRHQLISRRSRNATGTDDRAALAAQPRPGAQEGGCGAATSSL